MKRKAAESPSAKPTATTEEQIEELRRQFTELSERLNQKLPEIAPTDPTPVFKSLPPNIRDAISNSPERWPDATIIDRIERVLADKGITIKQFAFILGLSASAIYHRMDEETPFTLRELDLFARAVGAPNPWPLMEWETALAFERWLKDRSSI